MINIKRESESPLRNRCMPEIKCSQTLLTDKTISFISWVINCNSRYDTRNICKKTQHFKRKKNCNREKRLIEKKRGESWNHKNQIRKMWREDVEDNVYTMNGLYETWMKQWSLQVCGVSAM